MPDPKALPPNDLNRLQEQIAADFEAIAASSTPIRAQLLHRATNAERQGVVGTPHPGTGVASICTIGSRDFHYLTDADGRPLPSDKPITDFEGRPFVDDKGNPVMVEFPATRTLTLFGDPASVSRLGAVADRAGATLRQSPPVPNAGLEGWRAADDGGYWWLHVFELAIGGQLPLIRCERKLWNGNASFPYDLDRLRQLSQCTPAKGHIPEAWMTELPDAWYAELPDAMHACRELANYITADTGARVEPQSAPASPAAENGRTVLDALRKAIADTPSGVTVKPAEILRRAGVAEQRGRNGLRELEKLGEYNGFSRGKPARFVREPSTAILPKDRSLPEE